MDRKMFCQNGLYNHFIDHDNNEKTLLLMFGIFKDLSMKPGMWIKYATIFATGKSLQRIDLFTKVMKV